MRSWPTVSTTCSKALGFNYVIVCKIRVIIDLICLQFKPEYPCREISTPDGPTSLPLLITWFCKIKKICIKNTHWKLGYPHLTVIQSSPCHACLNIRLQHFPKFNLTHTLCNQMIDSVELYCIMYKYNKP